MPRVRPGAYALGMAGVALVRGWLGGDAIREEERAEDVARLLRDVYEGPAAIEVDIPELEGQPGYAAWAPGYDTVANPLIQIEEPLVRMLVSEVSPGDAVDAGCGTGRHTGWLAAQGFRVIGVDFSPEMLAAARAKHPAIDFREAPLTALPVGAATADLAVCALALMHLSDLAVAFAELGRVVRPGGRVIVSDLHPDMMLLGGGALFEDPDGQYAMVRSHPRAVGAYIEAARTSGLVLRHCLEPRWQPDHVPLVAGPLFALAPESFLDALVGIPAALILSFDRP